jgi:deoxyribose-phosphate aldolase
MPTNDKEITELLQFIDYTLLDSTFSSTVLDDFIKTAQELKVASLCVYPHNLPIIHQASPNHRLTTVINFPSGEQTIEEIKNSVEQSNLADELDVVFPYTTYLAGKTETAFKQMKAILALLPKNKTIKVIIESGVYASTKDITQICQFLITQPIHFIKTSTGKTPVGATPEAVTTILSVIKNSNKGLKISGGVRSMEQMLSYIEITEHSYANVLTSKNFRIGMSIIPFQR